MGNLNLTTNTLEIQDLQDTDQSKTTGGGINISGNGDNLELSSTYASKDKQGTSKATIGQGSITVNNEQDQVQLALLNRDINNSQETTRDWETERVDTTLKVDTRVFTEEGRKSIKKDFLDTKNHAQEIAQAVEDVATTDKSLLDFGSQVHKYATDRQLLAQKSSEQETQDKLKGEEGAEGSQQALEELSDELSHKDGLEETAEVNLYDGSELGDTTLVGDENDFNKTQAKAGYHEANQHIYINIDQTDMTDSSQTVRALVHEQERHTNAQNGSDYSEQSQTDLAKARGERAESVWNDYSDFHGIETKSTTTQKNWNQKNRKSQEVQTGTKKLAQVESEEVKPLITPDTIWDIANIAYDLGKAGYALTKGDEALLEEALKDLAADTVAALIPGLPAGTSKMARIAAKKLKDGKKLTKKESEALSQAVEAKKAQRQGDAQTPPITSGTSKSGGNNTDIPNIGSKHPNPDIQKNIDETMGHILKGTNPPRKIGGSGGRDWAKTFQNDEGKLPDLGKGGYKEYRVRPTESGGSNNVHRIVVGKDGNVYYSNTHYGTSSTHKGPAFYSAGKLSPEQIAKLFK